MSTPYRFLAACTRCNETFASDVAVAGIQWADDHSIYCGTVEYGAYDDISRSANERARWRRHEKNALRVG